MVDVVHADVVTFGWVLTAQGLGAVCVAYLMGRLSHISRRRQALAIWGSLAALSATCLVYTTFPYFWVLVPLTLAEGLILEVLGLAQTTWWQECTPDTLRGRVLALRETTEMGMTAVATCTGGAVAQVAGVRAAFYTYSALVLLAAVLARLLLPAAGKAEAPRTEVQGA
ncbi:MAG TPA: MFS transporter [Symbiobacteriaceae bacterium]|nr:MFS transporter [Symbiobacteriaceae bacterium]